MGLAEQLASAAERRDQQLNIELAQKLAKQPVIAEEILELFDIVDHGPKAQKYDAIKVLYELAALRPAEFSDHIEPALGFLTTRDNRILWGTMALLAEVTNSNPDKVYEELDTIVDAASRGSVIAKDNAIAILVKLGGIADYTREMQSLISAQLKTAAPNQLPKYAELSLSIFNDDEAVQVIEILEMRLKDLPTLAKRKRLGKVIEGFKNKLSS